MKINNERIAKRWNDVMMNICVEYNTINTMYSELETHKGYYGTEEGITVDWMIGEAEYWLSCYYEGGNCRCDDRFEGEDEYKTWVSETGKLKRLIALLKSFDRDLVVAEQE